MNDHDTNTRGTTDELHGGCSDDTGRTFPPLATFARLSRTRLSRSRIYFAVRVYAACRMFLRGENWAVSSATSLAGANGCGRALSSGQFRSWTGKHAKLQGGLYARTHPHVNFHPQRTPGNAGRNHSSPQLPASVPAFQVHSLLHFQPKKRRVEPVFDRCCCEMTYIA